MEYLIVGEEMGQFSAEVKIGEDEKYYVGLCESANLHGGNKNQNTLN